MSAESPHHSTSVLAAHDSFLFLLLSTQDSLLITFKSVYGRDSVPENQLGVFAMGTLLTFTFTQASISPAIGSIWLKSYGRSELK